MTRRKLAAAFLFTTSFLTAGTIRLKTREIETASEAQALAERPARRLDQDRRHILVEFAAPLNQDHLTQLALRGAALTSAVNQRTVMIAVRENTDLSGMDIVWTGALHANDRISPSLRNNWDGQAWIVEFHNDISPSAAERIAAQSDLRILRRQGLLSHQLLVAANPETLDKLAEWDEVAYIFPASDDLAAGRRAFPCSGALVQGQSTAQYVTVSTGWPVNSPSGVLLNYVFTTMTTKIPAAQAQGEVLRAMRTWSKIANVQFIAGTSSAAPSTVAIEWGTSVNNDPTSFPASGQILAHTYYPAPPNPEPIAGDLHFNPAENWHVGSSVDIYTVALHELGHALGLGHTDNPSDVMYPYYQYGVSLSANDIAGVQSLYGSSLQSSPGPQSGPSNTDTRTPLVLSVLTPASGSQTANDTVALSGSVLNGSSQTAVVWQSSTGRSGQAMGTTSWSASGVPLNAGVNLITVTASDPSHRSASSLVRITKTGGGAQPSPNGNTGAPSLVITSPQNGTRTTASSISVTGTASDPSGISQITWQTSGGATGAASGTNAWAATGIPLNSGQNVIVFRAYNAAGTMRWTSITITRQ